MTLTEQYFNSIMPEKYPVSFEQILDGLIIMGFRDE